MKYKILHYISVINLKVFIFCLLLTILNLTYTKLLNLPIIIVFDKFYLHQLIFIVISIYILEKYIKVDSSWRDYYE